MATAAFKFDTKKHGNINDSALKDLPLGKHNYVITKIVLAPVKADKTKKRKHLVIDLRHSSGAKFTQFLEIHPKDNTENEQIRARIAAEEFNAYVQAAGFEGVLTSAKFKLLYNKVIGIETVKTENKATKKSYVNVNQIIKDGFPDEELTQLGASDETDEKSKKSTTKKSTSTRKKKTPPKEEEEEEEDDDPDEEEEDDPDEEEEDDPDEEEEDDDDDDDDDPFA